MNLRSVKISNQMSIQMQGSEAALSFPLSLTLSSHNCTSIHISWDLGGGCMHGDLQEAEKAFSLGA